MGFDTHMILETVPVLPSTRQNAHQVINPTSRHYAEAVTCLLPRLLLGVADGFHVVTVGIPHKG
jgi:hypothetical protein